jgi:hypothetical protein
MWRLPCDGACEVDVDPAVDGAVSDVEGAAVDGCVLLPVVSSRSERPAPMRASPGGMQPLSFFASPGGQAREAFMPDTWPLVEGDVLPASGPVVPGSVPCRLPGIMLTPGCWRASRFEPGPYTFTVLVFVLVLVFALALMAALLFVLLLVEALPERLPETLPEVLGVVVEVCAKAPAAKKPASRTERSLFMLRYS